MGLNCYFYYSGIMTLPINVNENSLIMLNYQYIFYGIGSYATLNLRNIVEEKSEKRTKICLVMLFLLIIINIIMVKQQMENVIINHTWRLCYICVLWFVFDHLPQISIKSWMNDSFFLCCSHLIILQCSQRVCEIILSKMNLSGGIFSVLEFLILPIIIITFIGRSFKKIFTSYLECNFWKERIVLFLLIKIKERIWNINKKNLYEN